MTETIDKTRIADLTFSQSKKASLFVEKQFPSIYRENGKELIDLVKYYYKFLEEHEAQSVYNIRRIYDYRDIDTTLERMLIFFKNKFLNGLFFEEDTRFIVKNILDLYRRKGSPEGIELFFKLFFDSEVEVYYPSQDIFKPSTSLWKTGSFIQLYPILDTLAFSDITNRKIFGDKTNAEAFVDSVYFVNIRGAYVPILFISDVKGEFAGFDIIYTNNPLTFYGRVYGSLRTVEIDDSGAGSGGNKVGDLVNIISDTGVGAKGRVSKVTENLSGEIDFVIQDGNYGYTVSNTDILVSNQNAFFGDGEGSDFIINERITQINSSNTEIFGTVIGKTSDSIGIFLDNISDPDYFFEDGIEIETVSRETNISRLPLFVTAKNTTANAELGTIKNTETITIVTDLIENYLDVPLDSSNYSTVPPALLEMSGTRVDANTSPDLETPLNVAFVPETFTIGEIATLKNIDPGFDQLSDVFVLARENLFRRFNLQDQILNVTIPSGVLLLEGDIITQTKDIQTFEGNIETVPVRGRIVGAFGNNITVKQLTFESFVVEEPIFKEGSNIAITVNSRSRDFNSAPLGLNAVIEGNVETVVGKIQEIEVIDSGIGYEDESTVELINVSKPNNTQVDITGIARARSQGVSEGHWLSFESHINQEKVIQDSLYYQDYSYELTTDNDSTIYESEYRNLMHPTGLKLFTSFGKIDLINIRISLLRESISKYDEEETTEILSEAETTTVLSNGFQYLLSSIE